MAIKFNCEIHGEIECPSYITMPVEAICVKCDLKAFTKKVRQLCGSEWDHLIESMERKVYGNQNASAHRSDC